jgi:hypothetical protein
MKIAFLVLVHKAPEYVERLARVLESDGDQIFIHVDKAVDISSFQIHLSPLKRSTHLLSRRYAIAWGGFSMIRATNALIEAAVCRGTFDYFCLLSGQCFPIRPLSWLKQVLAEGLDYINCQPMPQPSKPMVRLERRMVNVKVTGLGPRGKRIAEQLLNLIPVQKFQTTFGLAPHAGSQWWCLKRETIEHVRNYRLRHPAYDRFMKWTHIPDEMYYQTLVANGQAPERITGSLTASVWIQGKESPEVITRSNLSGLLRQKVFLARKFQTDDFSLLDELESTSLSASSVN